jgi:hypothetical protein
MGMHRNQKIFIPLKAAKRKTQKENKETKVCPAQKSSGSI